jgi:hypothetical protein
MTNPTRPRPKPRRGDDDEPALSDLLSALGLKSSEVVSTLGRDQSGQATSQRLDVHQYGPLKWPPRWDVWFGVNPISKSVNHGRGTEADVTRVVAIFADLDVKEDSLETIEECREVVDRLSRVLGANPTAVVESGHGLQPYWRIASPATASTRIVEETVDGDSRWSRQAWREVYARWGGLVQQVVDEVSPSASIDNVYQLCRMMRCPGSINQKGIPVPVHTTIHPRAKPIGRAALLVALNAREAKPIAPVAPLVERAVSVGWTGSVIWVDEQPGTSAPMREMSPTMLQMCDFDGLTELFGSGTDEDNSAYNLMKGKVWSAVNLSVEGHPGLSKALATIHAAYVEAVTRRGIETPGKEPRQASVLETEFRRCLEGAVAKARTKEQLPLMSWDSFGAGSDGGVVRLNVKRKAD